MTTHDEVVGGSMTLLEHLLELRRRVMWSALAVLFGMMPFFAPGIGLRVVGILEEPATSQIANFRAQAITPMENVVVYFEIALMGGLCVGMPMLLYQTLAFVAPALTKQEKRWVLPITLGATVSFLVGVAFCYFVVLTNAYRFLFSFGAQFADPTPTISSYIDLTIRLLFGVGLTFEMPIVMMGLAKLGLVTAGRLWRSWRSAVVLIFVAAAILTPTPDPVTQTLVALPMLGLYLLSIALAWLVRH